MCLTKNIAIAFLGSMLLAVTSQAQIATGTVVVNNTTIASSSFTSNPVPQGPGNTTQYTTDNVNCGLVSTITSVLNLGVVTAQVTVNSTAGSYNGVPYVGRYYEIHPSQNANQSATVTLYFTQADFNAYNTAVAALGNNTYPAINVSSNPNLLITVFHGLPSDGTTGPNGQYDANNKEVIVPSSIVLNPAGFYEVTFTTPGFSGFFAHTNINGSPLKITLGSIAAENMGNRNRVDWSTLTEVAGDVFEVERSADGHRFEKVGTIAAQGNAPAQYSFLDEHPYTGVNYYRLVLLNANGGDRSYSKIVSATVKENEFKIDAYPNPVSNYITIKIKGGGVMASLRLTDASGRHLQDISLVNGTAQVPMKHLAQGIYFVQYRDNNRSENIKVYKQ